MIDVEPKDLAGNHVRLWPYSNQTHDKTALVTLCKAINESGAAHRVFWAHARDEGQSRVDLTFFLQYFQSTVLLFVQDIKNGELVGACWFDEVYPSHRGNYNMWFKRRAWGVRAREASELATRYGFKYFEFDTLWGITPWPLALRHGLALGWKHVATLPRYACVRTQLHDVYIVMREK